MAGAIAGATTVDGSSYSLTPCVLCVTQVILLCAALSCVQHEKQGMRFWELLMQNPRGVDTPRTTTTGEPFATMAVLMHRK